MVHISCKWSEDQNYLLVDFLAQGLGVLTGLGHLGLLFVGELHQAQEYACQTVGIAVAAATMLPESKKNSR